jgi:putative hydrolase of the HAD superfamily
MEPTLAAVLCRDDWESAALPITIVFLDLYQTLAYFHPPREERLMRVLREMGLRGDESRLQEAFLAADEFHTIANAEKPMCLRSEEERREVYTRYQQVVLEKIGLEQADGLAGRVYKRYWGLEREIRLFPDVEPTLARLREAGYRLGLITNVTNDPTKDIERVLLTEHFDLVIASCLVGFEKPSPRIFEIALEGLSADPSEAVHIGDQYLADVKGAEAAGIKAILLDRYGLQEGRHPLRIASLRELEPLLQGGLI